jgi:uncharacterized protein
MPNKLTPSKVLTELIDCFYEAHCQELDLTNQDKELDRAYCESLVKRAFTETEGDYENPTKATIINAMDWLAKFSKNFRDEELIESNYQKMLKRVDSLG